MSEEEAEQPNIKLKQIALEIFEGRSSNNK
jgi:hypothetical protein